MVPPYSRERLIVRANVRLTIYIYIYIVDSRAQPVLFCPRGHTASVSLWRTHFCSMFNLFFFCLVTAATAAAAPSCRCARSTMRAEKRLQPPLPLAQMPAAVASHNPRQAQLATINALVRVQSLKRDCPQTQTVRKLSASWPTERPNSNPGDDSSQLIIWPWRVPSGLLQLATNVG